MTYLFEHLNGGLEIVDPVITWTFAGFSKEGEGRLTVDVLLTTDKAKFKVQLSTVGQPTDRSDEAIEALMFKLLKPYEV